MEKVFSILYIFIKDYIVETTASQLQMLKFAFFTENSSQWLSDLNVTSWQKLFNYVIMKLKLLSSTNKTV